MQGNFATAGRKRAAVELIGREEVELKRTARRYSLCPEDAEDAYQRALEILLLKAPSDRPRELIRWTKTVVKHEALAIRRQRERLLGNGAGSERDDDPIAQIAAVADGPEEHLERHELLARSREALRALKPAELRTLTLLAAGYSYAEIGAITGFSHTKVNRCLAEGRERFRRILLHSEGGGRCADLGPLLSAYCDGEASAEEAVTVREHLRACTACRASMRAYRAAPAAAAALAPLPVPRSLLARVHEFLWDLHSRLPGTGGASDAGVVQMAAAGGSRGAGMAALAKVLTICAGSVGGAAACVAMGVAPVPLDIAPEHSAEARVERVSKRVLADFAPPPAESEQAPVAGEPQAPVELDSQSEPAVAEEAAGAVEYTAPPEPAPPPASVEPSAAPDDDPAGEFGP